MTSRNTNRWADDVRRLLRPLNLPPSREADIAQELAQHLADRYHELRASGADDERARREAIEELDASDLVAELARIDLNGRSHEIVGVVTPDIELGRLATSTSGCRSIRTPGATSCG